MEAISCAVSSASCSTPIQTFVFVLDYLPVDSPTTAAGSSGARVVSRALEVRANS